MNCTGFAYNFGAKLCFMKALAVMNVTGHPVNSTDTSGRLVFKSDDGDLRRRSRWASQPPSERGPPPYPFPTTRRYATRNEKDGQDEHKINIHLVPVRKFSLTEIWAYLGHIWGIFCDILGILEDIFGSTPTTTRAGRSPSTSTSSTRSTMLWTP